MSASLDSIYQSLNSVYSPQRDLYNKQIQELPGQYDAQVQGLGAQKDLAFQQIDNQANARGMLYSGAPTQDDRNYTQATYLPAVANLRSQQNQAQYGLQQALAQIDQSQMGMAQNQYGTMQAQEQQQQQFQQQMQAQAQQAALARQSYASASQSQAPSQQQVLASAFNQYDPSKQGRVANYTEQQIAPNIAAALNIPYQQALSLAYQYRKQVYKQ